MTRYNLLFVVPLVAISLFSCKKKKNNTPAPTIDSPVVYANYTELAPGNYWIYQDYKLDSVNGAAHPQGTFDSVFVEKDTVINGNTYHKYWDVSYGVTPSNPDYYLVSFLRDSLSYTVNSSGGIVFSSTDFTTIFKSLNYGPNPGTPDTITVTEQMGFKDSAITLDAGTFVTSSFREVFHFTASYPYGPTREYDRRYCKNIGLVSYTTAFYEAAPYMYERRLVRYHVQ